MSKLHVLPQSAYSVLSGLAEVAKNVDSSLHVDLSISTGIPSLRVTTSVRGMELDSDNTFSVFLAEVKKRPHIPCQTATLKTSGNQQPAFAVHYKTEGSETYFHIESVSDHNLAFKLTDSISEQFEMLPKNWARH